MKNCKNCNKVIDLKEVKRVFGKESSVALGGFCSARCYTLHNIKIIEPTGLQKAIGKLSIMTIPEDALIDGVVKELRSRECFVDADLHNDERIYSGDVFGQILGEQDEMGSSPIRIKDQKVLNQLEELNKLVSADYIMVTLS